MKNLIFYTFLALAACVVSGCSNYTKDYNNNTLVVNKNSSLVEVAVEDFKGIPVDSDSLVSYVEEQVAAYNDAHEKGAIKKTSIDTNDMSKAKLVLTYKDMESYNAFNLQNCILDDFENVDKAVLKGDYTSADGKQVSFDALSGTEKARVLVLSAETDVVIKGDILYYNEEVTVKDGIAACSGKDNAVIIFK